MSTAAKLWAVPLHSLHHTAASALILAGRLETEIAATLGHSSPQVTRRVYAHRWKSLDSDTLGSLARLVLANGSSGSGPERSGSKR